jgi:hypothetical protein
LEWVEAQSLQENPRNWRRHPELQLQALQDVIAEVGWAGVLLWNERTGRLIDGHARKRIARGKVPVLVGSWSEEQEKKILATLDPLAALAEADATQLDALLRDVQTGSTAVTQLLAQLAAQNGLEPPPEVPAEPQSPEEFAAYGEDLATEYKCPKCGYAWSGKAK